MMIVDRGGLHDDLVWVDSFLLGSGLLDELNLASRLRCLPRLLVLERVVRTQQRMSHLVRCNASLQVKRWLVLFHVLHSVKIGCHRVIKFSSLS